MQINLPYDKFIDHLNVSNAPVIYWKCTTATPYTFVTQFEQIRFVFSTASTTERDYIKNNYKVTQLNSDD